LIEKICEKTEGIVSIANYNCPGQIVITGEEAAVDAACEALKAAGTKRTVKLNVSGPFHSKMLTEAGENLYRVLEKVELKDFTTPYITNVTADYVRTKEPVKELLGSQVASSVRWQQSVERMIADGVDTFIERGPGKTLSGFMRKISRNVKMMNIETVADFEKVMEVLKGEQVC
jgi:[acyl-carrier-protein] S-malonyltransferase